MTIWQTGLAILIVAFLARALFKRFGTDRLGEFTEKRRAASRMVSRGTFIDGNRHLDVALALTGSTFFYENPDMQASLDLQWVREIEYAADLATGVAVHDGRVLRMRSQSQTFEFVLPNADVARWHMMLPPRGAGAGLAAPQVSEA